MPFVRTDPDVFLDHGGVTVWHGYDVDGPIHYWFTTNPETADDFHGHGHAGWFDARLLAARWSETPNCVEWKEYWTARFKTEAQAIRALVIAAIEDGRLPHAELTA